MTTEALTIRRLRSPEEVSGFCCQEGEGAPDLEEFVKADSFVYEEKRITRVYLVRLNSTLVGFFSLCCAAARFEGDGVETQSIAQLDDIRFAIPSILLARLAVDDRFRGQGLGRTLFSYSVEISRRNVARRVGCRLLTVDAYSHLRRFYAHMGCRVLGPEKHVRSGPNTIPMCLDLFPPPPQARLAFPR